MHSYAHHSTAFKPPARAPRLWARVLLVTSALLLGSCSSTKVAYEFLDWVLMWKIDRMVPLDAQQRSRVKSDIHTLHEWHRATQLPRYADYLEDLQKRLDPASVTAEQIHAETDQLQLMLDDILERAIPKAADIISGLTDDQVAAMLDNIVEERQEYIDENIKPGEKKRREKSAGEAKDYFKRFLGRLTGEQEKWIDDWSQQLVPYTELAAQQQLLWQEHLAKYLEVRQNRSLLEQGLRELMLYRTDNWNDELQQAMDTNQALSYALIARILNSASAKQQAHLSKRLNGYIADFRQLSSKSAPDQSTQ